MHADMAEILTPKAVRRLILTVTIGLEERELHGLKFEMEHAFAQLEISHNLLDQKYRRSLWLGHGCPIAGLSGDDGEQQCSGVKEDGVPRHIPLDFLRDPILQLEEELAKMKLTESGVRIPGLNDDAIQFTQKGI